MTEITSNAENNAIDQAIDRLKLIIENSPNVYNEEIKVSHWENYGKSRTYLKVIETSANSKHHNEYDYGYIDNKTSEYIAGKHDIRNNFTLGGRNKF